MYDLFNPPPDNVNSDSQNLVHKPNDDLSQIVGLKYIPNYLMKQEHDDLWNTINSNEWLGDLKRRVQHYGWKYDYKSRSINYAMYMGELPIWAKEVAVKLHLDGLIDVLPDQLIINEYNPGQGIANHVDCEPCFTNTIISISLGSPCVMDFINLESKEKLETLLEQRSLVVISGDARYKWTHGIATRRTDIYRGKKFDRGKRISMTFRKVIADDCKIDNLNK